MRRIPFVTSAVVFATVLSAATAFATPPTGDLEFEDYTRAQLTDSASVPINAGTTLVRGSYSIAGGGVTGWRRLPGTMVLAVNKGTLMLHGADNCGGRNYPAGQAAVVPAGVYEVHNPGKEPLEFFGVFFDQAGTAPKPLVDGPTEAAPAGCTGAMASEVRPSGVNITTTAAAPFVSSYYSHHATLEIKAGEDIFATHFDVHPGWSSGWFAHTPAVNVMEAGELTYVEAKDGKCDESEVYRAGEAFYHPQHRHIATNNGKEHVLITTIYFNVPHGPSLPGPGNQLAANDFSQPPPADCPRLR